MNNTATCIASRHADPIGANPAILVCIHIMSRQIDRSRPTVAFPFAEQIRRPLFWLVGALLVAGGFVLWSFGGPLLALLERGASARDWIAQFGPLAPLAYIGLNVAQVVLAPLPGNFMGLISGYLFGMFWGTFYSVVGLALGATLAISIGRYFGRPLLTRFYSSEKLALWEGKLRMRSPVLWCIVFMFPVPDMLIYVAGLSTVRLSVLLPSIVLGRSIGIMFANVVGGWSAHLPPEWLLVKYALLLLVVILIYRQQRVLRLYMLLGYRALRRKFRGGAFQRRVSGTNMATTGDSAPPLP